MLISSKVKKIIGIKAKKDSGAGDNSSGGFPQIIGKVVRPTATKTNVIKNPKEANTAKYRPSIMLFMINNSPKKLPKGANPNSAKTPIKNAQPVTGMRLINFFIPLISSVLYIVKIFPQAKKSIALTNVLLIT